MTNENNLPMNTTNKAIIFIETLFPKILRSIVQHPDELQIKSNHAAAMSSVTIIPRGEDVGLVLGTGGKTFKSLVMVARAIAFRHGWRFEINEVPSPMVRQNFQRPNVPPNSNWVSEPIVELLREVVESFTLHAFTVQPLDDDNTTNLCVTIDSKEGWRDDPGMETALSTIFNAIGKMQGRQVKVIYLRSQERAMGTRRNARPDRSQQPNNAKGRFCREIE